jgi:tetratricopeptide (TPR) repeat protein
LAFLHNSLPDRGDSTPTEGIKMSKSFPMGALYLSGMLLLAFATLAQGATADAEVILVIGKAEVRETSSGEWKQVKVQQQLPPGASVRTGDASQMAVLLKDQTQIRVNQQSTMKFKAVDEPGQETTVDLIQGRIWAQVKRALYAVTAAVGPKRALKMSTPTATIGIRGTDWDVEVGENGKTTVTVLSGEVDMSNDFGRVAIGSNEQAIAEAGKAPVKRLLSNARDRVQWVTAYRPAPGRWVKAPAGSLAGYAKAIESGNYGPALKGLEAEAGTSPQARLLLADLYLFFGRAEDSIKLLARDDSAMAAALRGRALTVAGRLDEARSVLAGAVTRHPGEIEPALALADLARLQGNADEALRLFSDVAAAQPASSEAWFGVGRIQNEKENIKPARGALDQAIRLAPDASGYYGERATLEALSGDYAAARAAFAEALRRQPDDYLAWTGLGILQLKTGQAEAALESFLKAGVLEPRFARAQLYAGVAYYRLENNKAAIESVKRAAEIDPKDPLPYVMLGVIHGDSLELRAATDAARAAQERMPNLKSMNQIANNQKGSANVGSALAAQGMEEWARAYATSTYNPFWAGSALFLADRYSDGFNKNTELYKGFLADPTVFGASNRSSSLVQTPGHYGSVAYIGSRADFSQQAIQGKLNGLTNENVPFAYSLTAELADGHDARPNRNTFQADGSNLTVGLGAKPSYELGLFYFGNNTDVKGHFSDPALLPEANLKVNVTRHDAGASYRLDPTSQIWFKLGDGSQKTGLSGSQVDTATAAGLTIAGGVLTTSPAARLDRNDVKVEQNDQQFRHSFEPARATRISWGVADSHDRMTLGRDQTFTATTGFCVLLGSTPGCVPVPKMHTTVDRDLRSTGAYVSATHAYSNGVDLQFDAHYQHTRASATVVEDAEVLDGRVGGGAPIIALGTARAVTREQEAFRELNHRFGIHFAPTPGMDLRAAYQRWRRPFGTGSLGITETSGIPVEDRLVDSGGLLTRTKARIDWQYDARRLVQFSADHRQVNNLQSAASAYFRQFGLTELAALRARKPVFDEAFDEFEKTPVFGQGEVTTGGAAINWLMTDDVSVAARYLNSSSRNTAAAAALAGKAVPYIPRHFMNLSAFWQVGGRWLLSGVANYRSQRFTDEANTLPINAGWVFGLRAYWESDDKKWSVEAAANNLHSDKNSAVERNAQLILNSTYRF